MDCQGMEFKKLEVDGLVWRVKPYTCNACRAEGFEAALVLSDGMELEVACFPDRKTAVEFITSAKKAGITSKADA